jgi:hypothetical protein
MNKIHERLIATNKDYALWHNHPYHEVVHWAVFLIVGLGLVNSILFFSASETVKAEQVYSQTSGQSSANSNLGLKIKTANELARTTRSLLNSARDIRRASSEDKPALIEQLKSFAQSRHDIVLSLIESDPQTALNSTINPSLLAGMPSEVRDLIEQRKQISGKFEYIHIHYGEFDTGTTEDLFYITDNATSKRYRIHIPEDDIGVLTDDIVTVDGVVLDDQIASSDNLIEIISSPNGNKPSAQAPRQSFLKNLVDIFKFQLSKARAAAPVQKKVAVIMFNWQNDTRTTFTESSARGSFFTNSNSANSYYKENSFGKLELIGKLRSDGDVFGWVTIPYNNTGCSTMYSTWANAAEAQLQSQGVDLSGYNIKTYVFPSASCGWSGLAYVGGDPSRSWVNGTSIGTITHEVGHNLGSHHASSWSCTENGVRVAVSADANCVLGEYGDPYDVMGNAGGMRHMNNYHKGVSLYSLNWLLPQNTQTIDRNTAPDGVYTIAPIEQLSSGVQSLRIPRNISGGTVQDYYYLEFRQPFGFDQSISSNVTNGVTVRIAPNYNVTTRSKIVDATPGTSSFTDAPLAVGKTFVDPYKTINVTTLSADPNGAQVRVSFGPLPCTNVAPLVSITPSSQTGSSGTTLSYNVTVINNDAISCSGSSYNVTPTLPPGFFQSPASFNTGNIAPGESQIVVVNITASDTATAGNYSFSEKVVSTVNNSLNYTANATYVVEVPDTISPTVTITKPADGSKVPQKGNLQIVVKASDNVGVQLISIFFDNVLIKSCSNTTSCSNNVQVNKLSSGVHYIDALATDAAGNTASVRSMVVK